MSSKPNEKCERCKYGCHTPNNAKCDCVCHEPSTSNKGKCCCGQPERKGFHSYTTCGSGFQPDDAPTKQSEVKEVIGKYEKTFKDLAASDKQSEVDHVVDTNEMVKPSSEEWEIALGQLCARAWAKGLWHSESELTESFKSFIRSLLLSQKEECARMVEEFIEMYIDDPVLKVLAKNLASRIKGNK